MVEMVNVLLPFVCACVCVCMCAFVIVVVVCYIKHFSQKHTHKNESEDIGPAVDS